jgi:predicted transcriptional regulator
MSRNNLRDGRVRSWFYLENDLLDRDDLNIYEKTVYIVIARYVNSENKAFPSYETIAKKGSMAKVQAMRVVKSLIRKGLLKKEARKNKANGGSTSNLYTLLNPKPNSKGKKEGVSDRYPGSIPQISGVVSHRYPNNTNIKKTNLNNVKRASSKEVVENSEYNANGYSKLRKYRFREKEELAREIAEELDDNHSLGAFRAIVDKISEQRIRIFLSIIKDTYLTGKIRKNKGAMFISLAKAYAGKNNINLNLR